MAGFTDRSHGDQWRLRQWWRGFRQTVSIPFAKRQWDASFGTLSARDALTGWPWYVLSFAGLGVLCAFLGPFGTFSDMAPLPRLAYWVSIFVVNCLQVLGALALLARLTQDRWSLAALAAGASLLASVPATAEVALLEYLLRSNDHAAGSLVDIFTKVLVLTLAVTVPGVLIRARLKAPTSPVTPPAPAGPDGTTLLKRVKPEMRGDLWALQMEDHYLRVHTSSGNDLILHRMSDALADVAGLEGLQVHRSYWVARAAVAGAERDGRRLVLVLKNGLKIPVSRANVSAIKDAGWV